MGNDFLNSVKTALRIKSTDFDGEVLDLIEAAEADLGIVGMSVDADDPLTKRAIITYCRANFGEPDNYDKLKASYDEQKGQFRCCSKYMEDE